MNNRIKKLQDFIDINNTVAIINSVVNRRYFTGVKSSAGTLLVFKDESILIIDSRYHEMAEKTCSEGIKVVKEKELIEQISSLILKKDIKHIILETNILVSQANYYKEKFNKISVTVNSKLNDYIESLRCIKDKDEIDSIKKAQSITDAAFTHICKYIKPGKSEIEIMLELEFFMRRNGADGLAFNSIVVGGCNSSLPHGTPSEYKIKVGDMLTMDFGASYNGYCSDMTRTVAVGHATEEMITVYNTVLLAQTKAEQAVKSGLICKEIDKIARDIINNAGYGDNFEHGTGHSLGLEIHESPNFNTKCEKVLESGTVMSVEPGIYLKGKFGVRIEDIIVVTDNGCEILTKSPKELIIIK